MVKRFLIGLAIGIITFLVVWVGFSILSALLPGVKIDSHTWGIGLGLLAFFVYLFTGKKPNQL